MGVLTEPEDTYWYVKEYNSLDEARQCFKAYAEAGHPVLLFESTAYPDTWYVASYCTDEEHLKIRDKIPPSVEEYCGVERLKELYHLAILIDAENFGTKNIDEIIFLSLSMQDKWHIRFSHRPHSYKYRW